LEDTENLLNGDAFTKKKLKDDKFVPMFKERKKHDRFNGMPEEEVSKRTLPDHLALNLDIVIVSMVLFEWLKYATTVFSLVCLCVQIGHLCHSVILFSAEGTKCSVVVQ
jgi:hypothetical protein